MHTTPKDFFLWVGAMVALYFSIGSFITLSFEYINRTLGDPSLYGYDPYSGAIRFAIATLIVLFPVFIALMRMLQKDIRANPQKKELWVRRWAIFFTTFVAAGAMVIDLIVLINTFLGGEDLTGAFVAKVVVVFTVFGGVFYYYVHDIRGTWEQNERASKRIGWVVMCIVLATIVSGFFVMGSPQKQRMLRDDETRINDLTHIQSQVTEYYRTTASLPENLNELDDPLLGSHIPTDPHTNEPYEYQKIDEHSFVLCTSFALPMSENPASARSPWGYNSDDWQHGAGRTCFERTINPDRLPPYEKTLRP